MKHDEIVAQHWLYVKILKSLPKQKTTDFLILKEVKKNNFIQPARPSH